MDSIWHVFFIMESFRRCSLMIISQYMPIINSDLPSLQEEWKFGLWFWKNAGLSFMDHIQILLEDCLIKYFMHLVLLPCSIAQFQLIRLSKMPFGKKCCRIRGMDRCSAAELEVTTRLLKIRASLKDMHILS